MKSVNDETAKNDNLIDLVIQLVTFLYPQSYKYGSPLLKKFKEYSFALTWWSHLDGKVSVSLNCWFFKGKHIRGENVSWNFSDKLPRMTSNDAFRENLTFSNDYFKW